VLDKGFLGFGGEASPEQAPSKKQRRKRLDALRHAAQQRIRGELLPALRERFDRSLSDGDEWELGPATLEEDPDGQTLLFHYPTAMAGTAAYIRPVVKIEFGARSDNEPVEQPTVSPYLADAFADVLGPSEFTVRALAPERSFWEKAMLLHEETYRPLDKRQQRARMARHYYDLWCLISRGIAERAAARDDIFTRAAQHREIYFRWSWMDYSTLARGRLRVVPLPEQEAEWRRDYQAMRAEMFFGEVPDFDEILRVVREFQNRFNEGGSG